MSGDDTTILDTALSAVPPGRWAIAVSGGADSVALLMLAVRARPVADWHVVHLDHNTRGGASAADADFVRAICDRIGVASTIRTIDQIDPPAAARNRSARFRAARLALFREVVRQENLAGVLQAHHGDDQAETVLLRLLRGGPVVGIRPASVVGGLTIVRPLLAATRMQIRRFLGKIGQNWRDDDSNKSPDYARNRARVWLQSAPDLSAALVRLGHAGAGVAGWIGRCAPLLEESPAVENLANLPEIVALESARRWLSDRGSTGVDAAACRRLVGMAVDLATASTANFPGNLRVCRRAGHFFAEKPAKS